MKMHRVYSAKTKKHMAVKVDINYPSFKF